MTCQSFCKVIFLRAGVQTLRVQKIMISSFFQCHGMEGYFFQCSRNYFTSWRFCCLSSSIFSATISKYHFPPLILWKLISNIKSRVQSLRCTVTYTSKTQIHKKHFHVRKIAFEALGIVKNEESIVFMSHNIYYTNFQLPFPFQSNAIDVPV